MSVYVAVLRWQFLSRYQATLAGDGRGFAQVEIERMAAKVRAIRVR
jgi:hypothetical protein